MLDDVADEQIDYMVSRIPMGRTGTGDEVAEILILFSSVVCLFSTAVFDMSGGKTPIGAQGGSTSGRGLSNLPQSSSFPVSFPLKIRLVPQLIRQSRHDETSLLAVDSKFALRMQSLRCTQHFRVSANWPAVCHALGLGRNPAERRHCRTADPTAVTAGDSPPLQLPPTPREDVFKNGSQAMTR